MTNLYYIRILSSDSDTPGLVEIPDVFFSLFKEIIETLNRTSEGSYAPCIDIYKVIDKGVFRKATEYDRVSDRIYCNNGNVYVRTTKYFDETGLERIIYT